MSVVTLVQPRKQPIVIRLLPAPLLAGSPRSHTQISEHFLKRNIQRGAAAGTSVIIFDVAISDTLMQSASSPGIPPLSREEAVSGEQPLAR